MWRVRTLCRRRRRTLRPKPAASPLIACLLPPRRGSLGRIKGCNGWNRQCTIIFGRCCDTPMLQADFITLEGCGAWTLAKHICCLSEYSSQLSGQVSFRDAREPNVSGR